MGRRDAVQVILEVNARARQIEPALQITYEPGWETRGNGMVADYLGGEVHHTAFLSSFENPFPAQGTLRNGRVGLSGPLANYGGPVCTVEAPRLHVVAAHPSNNAGASGGRSMGPLPTTTAFNKHVLGLEIDYAGLTPMFDGQLYAAYIWARAVADVLAGGNLEYVRAHFETSITGKWDPGYASGKSIDMGAFRRAAAALTTGGTDVDAEQDRKITETFRIVALLANVLVSPKSANEQFIGDQLRGIRIGGAVSTLTGAPQALDAVLAEVFGNSRAILAAIAADDVKDAARDAAILAAVKGAGTTAGVDPTAIVTAVRDATNKALAEAKFPTAIEIAEATLAAQERAELAHLRARVQELEAAHSAA